MFPFRRSLILVTSLALMPVAGVASAGQSRQRSAPRSQGSSSSGSSSSSQGSSEQGRSRTQAQPRQRESAPEQRQTQQQSQRQQQPPQQYQRPQQQYQRPQQQPYQSQRQPEQYARPQQNDSRYSDRRQEPSRQAIPAPRDRYIAPSNRGYQSYGNITRYDGRYDRYDSRYSNYSPYRYNGPRVLFAPRENVRFSSPWFSFRALVRLPFGLTLGMSTPFPSWYRPYIVGRPGYTQPYMPYGGVTFDIQPGDAELWIDGEYMGRTSDYDYDNPPLTLVAGLHSVELRSGYGQPLAFDITIIPGQVIPYQGSLPYYR